MVLRFPVLFRCEMLHTYFQPWKYLSIFMKCESSLCIWSLCRRTWLADSEFFIRLAYLKFLCYCMMNSIVYAVNAVKTGFPCDFHVPWIWHWKDLTDAVIIGRIGLYIHGVTNGSYVCCWKIDYDEPTWFRMLSAYKKIQTEITGSLNNMVFRFCILHRLLCRLNKKKL